MIEQPWGDCRLKINGAYVGCVTKENADEIMGLQARVKELEAEVKHAVLQERMACAELARHEGDYSDMSIQISEAIMDRGR